MAITSLDGIIGGMRPPEDFLKVGSAMQAAGIWHSLLYAAGRPGAGSAPASGLAGAALTSLTGQIPWTNPASGNSYLARLQAASTLSGTLMLADRLWDNSGFTLTTTTAETVNSAAWPARDRDGSTNGENVLVGIEVSSATGNGGAITNTTLSYCVDGLTEALTNRGWKRYDEIEPGDEILAYDPATHITRWERPREIFVNPSYCGELTLLSNSRWSALVTPDHRWPVRHLRSGRVREQGLVSILRTHELPGDEYALLRQAPHAAPEHEEYSDAFVRVVAWYFTEGSLMAGGKNVTLCQSDSVNPQHVETIRRDLEGIGAGKWSERRCFIDGCDECPAARGMCKRHYHSWWERDTQANGLRGATPGRTRRQGLWAHEYVRRGDIVTWVLSGDGVDKITACVVGSEKRLSVKWLCSLSARQLKMFVDTCLAGDGDEARRLFYQHDKARMDGFVAAAVLAGYGPSVSEAGTTCALHEDAPHILLSRIERQNISVENELIWCPVTASSHWVARRCGKTFITGNTNSSGTGSKTGTIASFPASAVAGTFVPFALAAGDTGVRSIQSLTKGTSYVSGAIHLVAYRILAAVELPLAAVGSTQDSFKLGLPRCYNNTVPWLLWLPTATTAINLFGQVSVSQG